MARSNFIRANEKIARGVTKGFQKLSGGVVAGYTKIEDLFVGRYLTREGESVAQAKARLRREAR